jgi:hypothetical protein
MVVLIVIYPKYQIFLDKLLLKLSINVLVTKGEKRKKKQTSFFNKTRDLIILSF